MKQNFNCRCQLITLATNTMQEVNTVCVCVRERISKFESKQIVKCQSPTVVSFVLHIDEKKKSIFILKLIFLNQMQGSIYPSILIT